MEAMDSVNRKACVEYEARLEDCVTGEASGAVASEVALHLKSCEGCRRAFDAATASTRFLRIATPLVERAMDPGPGFARLVMARIRTEANERAQKSISAPVATFAWRFAMTATVAVALLMAYASRRPEQVSPDVAQMHPGDLLSDPAAPASRDDVLRMVVYTDNGK
jgi:predicted anti-sigma-YlaC factor YlaD